MDSRNSLGFSSFLVFAQHSMGRSAAGGKGKDTKAKPEYLNKGSLEECVLLDK